MTQPYTIKNFDNQIDNLAPSRIKDFIELTKPGVLLLIIVTAIMGVVIADNNNNFFLNLVIIIAIALASSGSAAFNMWYDRDIDKIMTRTQNRPVVTGRISADNALAFGCILMLTAYILMFLAGNFLATALLIFASFFYIYIYTICLKRKTPQNIVIGGAAGAFPPMISYAAVTGSVSLSSFILFLIIFIWTPPHFWALALKKNNDYKLANIPMMPIIKGTNYTINQIIIYSLIMICLTYLLIPTLPKLGIFYISVISLLNLRFIQLAFKLKKDWEKYSMPLFGYSIVYMFLLVILICLDNIN